MAAGLEQFAQQLLELLRGLLRAVSVDYVVIEHRVKSAESISVKLADQPDRYTGNPFLELPDLLGLRIVTRYTDDDQRLDDLLRREFELTGEPDDKRRSLAADEMRYTSIHYEVRLDERRRTLPEWEAFAGVIAEIQVRSLLEHTWSVIHHDLLYKSGDVEIPDGIRREFARVKGQLEIADDLFVRAKHNLQDLYSYYLQQFARGRWDDLVSVPSVDAYARYANIDTWLTRAVKDLEWHWPTGQEPGPGGLDSLKYETVELLNRRGITTIRALRDLMPETYEEALEQWRLAVQEGGGHQYLGSSGYGMSALVRQQLKLRDQ